MNDFERSNDKFHPLSIWYNGLLAACETPGKIVTELCVM